MNRLIAAILLENQGARPFGVFGVILDDDCSTQTVDDVTHRDPVGCELIVSVKRHLYLAPRHEGSYLFQELGHFCAPVTEACLGR